ncbi:MAG: peptidylprolyl isomerase [Myxococcales bacterium]|nr:peptidylprolyl isomerase [Myxococcales bacterium]
MQSRRKTTLYLAALLAALAALVTLTSRARDAAADDKVQLRTVERIVGIVNDQILLLSQLNERLQPMIPRLQQIQDLTARQQKLAELRRQALEQMVDEKLIAQQALKLKLKVTDNELERAIKDVMKRNSLTKAQLEQALQREGKSLYAYKHQLLAPQLLRLKVLNVTVRSRVSVSEDEIKAQYQKNLRALGVDAKVNARHIFVEVPSNAGEAVVAKRRALAKKLYQMATKKGADFAALAKQHSQDPVTRAQGGDLGWFGRGTLPTDIEDVVFKMKKGEIRGPLRGGRGFHVIQVVDTRASSARPYKEVRRQLRGQIYGRKLEKATKAWLREVRKKAHIVIKI